MPNCNAQMLDDNPFQNLQGSNVKCVNVSNCGLTLVTKAFSQLTELETLDLNKNPKVFIVYPRFFNDFMQNINNTKLNYPNVQKTGLSEITASSKIGTLENINVERNQLHDLPPGLSSVKSFAAAYNRFSVGRTLFELLKYEQNEYIGRVTKTFR